MTSLDQLIADLQWIIHTPPLIDAEAIKQEFGVELLDFRRSYRDLDVRKWASNPSRRFKLEQIQKSGSHRVGNYFEDLALFLIEELRGHTILDRNLQIFEGQRTVGEIDCLYEDANGVTHLEVAVKFFLLTDQVPATSPANAHSASVFKELACYVGPNPADSFASKLSHLLYKQLPLSRSPQFQAVSRRVVHNHATMFAGVLHYHRSGHLQTDQHFAPHDGKSRSRFLNPQYRKGTWFWYRELEEQLATLSKDTRIAIPRKPCWLAPGIASEKHNKAELLCELQSLGEGRNATLLLIDDPYEKETERCFVVADHWPSQPDSLKRSRAGD